MKARVIKEKKENVINDLRNGGKMVLVRSNFDRHGNCTGFYIHIGKVIRQDFHINSTMVVTDLGFDNRDTLNAIEDIIRDIDNIFCSDETAVKFMNKVISTSDTIDKSKFELVRYY